MKGSPWWGVERTRGAGQLCWKGIQFYEIAVSKTAQQDFLSLGLSFVVIFRGVCSSSDQETPLKKVWEANKKQKVFFISLKGPGFSLF